MYADRTDRVARDCEVVAEVSVTATATADTTIASATATAITSQQGGPRSSEVQRVTLRQGDGRFTLTFEGQTTRRLPWDASADVVQIALTALTTIGFRQRRRVPSRVLHRRRRHLHFPVPGPPRQSEREQHHLQGRRRVTVWPELNLPQLATWTCGKSSSNNKPPSMRGFSFGRLRDRDLEPQLPDSLEGCRGVPVCPQTRMVARYCLCRVPVCSRLNLPQTCHTVRVRSVPLSADPRREPLRASASLG